MNTVKIIKDSNPIGSINLNDTDWKLLNCIDYIEVNASGKIEQEFIDAHGLRLALVMQRLAEVILTSPIDPRNGKPLQA